MISKNLENCKFTKLMKDSKKPIIKDWVNNPLTYKEALNFVKEGFNVGLLCGYGDIVCVDCDSKEFASVLKNYLPTDTYAQLSANRNLPHYVYKCKGWNVYKLLKNPDRPDIHHGEIMSKGRQLVISPSKIGVKKYKVINDVEPREITSENLYALIHHFEGSKVETETKELKYNDTELDNIPIRSIMDLSGFKKGSNNELYGPNPWHGSETGANTWINESKNVAYCFRCASGISPIKAIALNKGIITSCDSLLRGDDFKDAYQLAIDLSYITPKVEKAKEIIRKEEPETEVLELRDYRFFEKIKKPKEYLINDFLPLGSLVMLYSAPGMFKSIVSQQMGMCITNKRDFLGLKTMKFPVLYSDKENNDLIIKERLTTLRKGNNVWSKNFPLYYLNRKEGDLDSAVFIFKLTETVRRYKIKLLILDTLNRHSDYDENSATELSKLYTSVFMPLIEDLGISIIFLHHTNKTGGYRGSGDFLGMCDIVYRVDRKGKSNNFKLINEKNRLGEIEEITAKIVFDENKIIFERIEGEDPESERNKFMDLLEKVKSIIGTELCKRKDIEEQLKVDNFEYSLSTLKNCLSWSKKKGIIYQPRVGVYALTDGGTTTQEESVS